MIVIALRVEVGVIQPLVGTIIGDDLVKGVYLQAHRRQRVAEVAVVIQSQCGTAYLCNLVGHLEVFRTVYLHQEVGAEFSERLVGKLAQIGCT